jgi:acyl dehydratase
MGQQAMEFHDLNTGHRFPAASFRLDSDTVAAYLESVEETSPLYSGSDLVPPLAVAALAMAALSESLSFPSGAIHVSQEVEFLGEVTTRDDLTSHASVSRKQDRGKLHMLTIDFNVVNQSDKPVLYGKTSFILPITD